MKFTKDVISRYINYNIYNIIKKKGRLERGNRRKMKYEKRQDTQRNMGITLVALVITIIVLLILAGITITLTIGQNGIIARAQEAGKNYLNAQDQELEGLNNLDQTAENMIAGVGNAGNIAKDPNQEIIGDGRFVNGVNTPKLENGMTAIVYDGTSLANENIPEGWRKAINENEWYNYENQQWANAVTEDGSMWVWIPRYEYKITNYTIDINFIPTSTTQKTGSITEGYRIHPAFEDGSENGKNNHYMNGEWDSELAGIWIAKFEASRQDNTSSTQGSSNTIKIQPNVKSWVNINVGDSYTNSINMYPKYNSHLMKNSEWGAVAYLSYSVYGTNGTDIKVNTNTAVVTGGGDYKTNTNQSTTGNISGIYDLSGGAWEWTAGYISNGNSTLSSSGSSFTVTTANSEGYKTLSTKYATVYPYNSSNDTTGNNQAVYNNLKSDNYGYGDAILETSGWNGERSQYPHTSRAFFARSANYSDGTAAGVFAYDFGTASAREECSFRPALAF